jgi:hypothetical protein
MSKRTIGLIAAAAVLAGVVAGVAGAQIVQSFQRQFLNTGLFSVGPDEIANFHVSLDDARSGPPARVILQLIDETGAVVASTGELVLQAGHSASLRTPGPGLFRAHAEVIETVLQLSARRTSAGTVEVINSVTGVVRPIPSFDPQQIPSGP